MSELTDLLLVLAASIFQPVVVEAVLFIVVFNVSLMIISWVRGMTNLSTKGGEM